MSRNTAGPSGASNKRMPPLPAALSSQSRSDSTGLTSGTRFLPHCSQAAATTACQCTTRFAARSPDKRTTQRSAISG